jgi:glycosyltransferase involved in cell wall biosynthesis
MTSSSAAFGSQADSLRVAFVTAYPPQADGIATHAEQLIDAVGPAVHVEVVTRRKPVGEDQKANVPVKRVLSENPFCFSRVLAALLKSRPDVVHLQYNLPSLGGAWLWAVLASGWARRRIGCSVVVTLHEVRRDLSLLGPVGGWLLALLGRWSDKVIVYTSEAKDLLVSRCRVAPDHIVVMPHGAPPPFQEDGCASPPNKGRAHDAPIVTFGYLHPDKGIEHLIDAVGEICRRRPSLLAQRQLIIAGAVRPRRGVFRLFERADHRYATSLVRRVDELGLGERVVFSGHVPSVEVGPLLTSAAVAVLPYRNTTQSGVLNLLLAARAPIVATDLPGLRETLGEAGLFVPVGDHVALAQCIEQVLDDDQLAARLSSAVAAQHRHVELTVVGARLRELYNGLAARQDERRGASPATALSNDAIS